MSGRTGRRVIGPLKSTPVRLSTGPALARSGTRNLVRISHPVPLSQGAMLAARPYHAPMIAEMLALVAGGALAYSAYWVATRERRLLRRAKVWPIGELPEDTIGRLIGSVRPVGPTLIAPLTGRECVCYLVTVDALGWTQGGQTVDEIVCEEKTTEFVLEDESGRMLVEPAGAMFELRRDAYSNTPGGNPNDRERAFLARHRQQYVGTMSFHEMVVEVGKTICVAGAGTREGDPDAEPREGYRAAAPTRLRFTNSRKLRLLITDA